MRNKFLIIALLFATALGCKDDDNVLTVDDQLAKDVAAIDAYLLAHNISAIIDTTGIRYVIHKEGAGTTSPNSNSCVKVSYVGRRLKDDFEFEKNLESTKGVAMLGLITGWQIGLGKIQAGDSISLYVPSGLAYKTAGRGENIGRNENLYFGVQLNAIGAYYFNPAIGAGDCEFIVD